MLEKLSPVISSLQNLGFVVVAEKGTGCRLARPGADWSVFLCNSGRLDFTGVVPASATQMARPATGICTHFAQGREQFQACILDIEEGRAERLSAQRGRSASKALAGW